MAISDWPARPRFQYSLAGLLGFTTFVSVVLSLFRWLYVKYGLDKLVDTMAVVITVVVVGSIQVGCAAWAIADARKRGQSGALVSAFFAWLGPFGAILGPCASAGQACYSIGFGLQQSRRRLSRSLSTRHGWQMGRSRRDLHRSCKTLAKARRYALGRITQIEEKRSRLAEP